MLLSRENPRSKIQVEPTASKRNPLFCFPGNQPMLPRLFISGKLFKRKLAPSIVSKATALVFRRGGDENQLKIEKKLSEIQISMKFPKLFHKSNSSIHQLQGNVLDCSIEQIRGNKVLVNTGMRSPFVCFQDELCEPAAIAEIGYKFFWQDYEPRHRLSDFQNLPGHNKETSQKGSIKRWVVASQSFPTERGDKRQSMPEVASRVKFPRELAARTIHEAFAPFLTLTKRPPKRTKTPFNPNGPLRLNLWLRESAPRTNHRTTKKGGSIFWFFLRLAFVRSRQHLSNQTEFVPSFGGSHGSFSMPRGPEVQTAHAGAPDGSFVALSSGSARIAYDKGTLRGGKNTRPVRILGAPKGLMWIHGDSQDSENPNGPYADAPFTMNSHLSSSNNKGSLAKGVFSIRPTVLGKEGLGSLKGESVGLGRRCVIGIEEKRSSLSEELICSAPKSMETISKRKIVWTEMTKLCRTSAQNRIKFRSRLEGSVPGFILNSVNGGYAVAIAGYIAFLPKSLCITKKVFIGQWRQFAIISMNPKIANIVVKEVRTNLLTPVMSTAKIQKKQRKRNSPS